MACYVPFCESERGEKLVSFHQFPSDEILRKKWIIAIGRKDLKTGAYWDPHSSASVCSLHFSPKQFKGNKQVHLIPGSIPFIFPDYYLPERGASISQADLASMKMVPFPSSENPSQQSKSVSNKSSNACETSSANNVNSGNSSEHGSGSSQLSIVCVTSNTNDIDKINKAKRTFAEFISPQTVSNKIANKQLPFHVRIIPASKMQKFMLSQPKNGGNVTHEASSSVALAEEDSSPMTNFTAIGKDKNTGASFTENILKTNFQTIGGDTNTGTSHAENVPKNTARKRSKTCKSLASKLRLEARKTKLHNEVLMDQVLELQEENKTLVAKNRSLEQKLKAYNFSELNMGILRSDAKALFIFDQLRSFAERKCTLTKSSLNFVKNLEKNFPECYKFLTEADYLTLPSSSDLDTNVD